VTYHIVIKEKIMILAYSVKNYCVLKMTKNKEEIRYTLKFHYKKGKNATQTVKKICDVYGHDAVSVRIAQAGSSLFNLEILMSKMHLAGRPIWKGWMKSWKNLKQNRHNSSHDIHKELNIDHKTVLNHLEKAGYKKTRCLSAT